MWFVRPGEGYLVSMDNPTRLFSQRLVRALEGLNAVERRQLVAELKPYFQQLWDDLDAMVPSENEGQYVNLDPPSAHHLDVTGEVTSAGIIDALKDTPLRWRVDLAMALDLYLTIDLEDPEAI